MSEKGKSDISFDEWLKRKKGTTQQAQTRAEAFKDGSPEKSSMGAKNGFAWIEQSFSELNDVFKAIEFIYEANEKLAKKVQGILALSLGLPLSAKWEEVETRAKEFGEFVTHLINKAKEERELERLR